MLTRLEGFDDDVTRMLAQWKVPGTAVAILKDGEVVHCRGYGLRDVENALPVTSKTLFAIGSTTKAFTSMAIGLLVDEGKMEWDKPVRAYLPSFKLFDPVASERLTVRDLLCQRCGLPRHELVWYRSPATRAELVERLQYLEPTCDFRTQFQYQNILIMLAGYLAGVVAGTTYEDFITERIFKPLGMLSSNFSVEASQLAPDFAYPYHPSEAGVEKIPFRGMDAIGPAGSINSNLEDMSRWILMHLNKGKIGDQQIISEASLREMHSPQMIAGEDPSGRNPEISFMNYGLCWAVFNYRGHKAVWHNGGIDGFLTDIGMIPDKNLAVIVFSNADNHGMTVPIYRQALDRMLGLEPVDWNGRIWGDFQKAQQALKEAKTKPDTDRVPGTQPSHPLEAYAGEYTHPGYGTLQVELKDGCLVATFNTMEMPAEHYHYDIFSLNYTPFESVFKATFLTDLKGEVGSVAIPFEPSVKSIVFTRVPAAPQA